MHNGDFADASDGQTHWRDWGPGWGPGNGSDGSPADGQMPGQMPSQLPSQRPGQPSLSAAQGWGPQVAPSAQPGGFPGPAGDWLSEPAPAWASAPPPYAPPHGHGPWVTPPPLEPETQRGFAKFNLAGAAPWLVAGLIGAVLLTGRGAPAPVATGTQAPVATGSPASTDVVAVAPPASCAEQLP